MQEQIRAWAAKFGMQTGQIEAGIGAVLGFIESKIPPAQFEQLQALVPQARQWIEQAKALPAAGAQAGGDLLGKAQGLLGQLAGGGQGAAAQVLARLQAAGFRLDTALQFAGAVLDELKAVAGPEKFNELLASAPALKDALFARLSGRGH